MMKSNQMLSINSARENKVRLIRFASIVLVMVCMMSMFTGVAFANTKSASDMLKTLLETMSSWINPLMAVGAAAAALAFIGVSIAKLVTSSQQATDRYSQWQKRILIALVCIVGVQFIFNFIMGIVGEVAGDGSNFTVPEGVFSGN